MTRLIGQYRDRGQVQAKVYRRHRFATRYQRDDIALIASYSWDMEAGTGKEEAGEEAHALAVLGKERVVSQRADAAAVIDRFRPGISREIRQTR